MSIALAGASAASPMCATQIEFLRSVDVANLTDASKLETIVLPRLGFNSEILNEQPAVVRCNQGGLRIWQYPNQFSKYAEFLAKTLQPKSYLEIGCRWGGTFIFTVEFLARVQPGTLRHAVAVDNDAAPIASLRLYVPPAETCCGMLCMDSHDAEFARFLSGSAFDVVFIDGDHTFEGVSRDFAISEPIANVALVFHDIISDACPGVKQFWTWLKAERSDMFDFVEFVEQYPEVLALNDGKRFLGIGVAVRKLQR